MKVLLPTVVLFGTLLFSGCGGGSDESTSPTQTNTAPTINGTSAVSVTVPSTYSFTPTAQDADGDTLTFSITNKPTWATFEPTTGALSGTPTSSDKGTYSNIVISVSDGKATVSLSAFSLEVIYVNEAPTISGTATSALVGQAYSFIPTVQDANGDTLTFSIANKPAWADFNASNGALTGTPTTYGTTADINISVSDGEMSASLPLFSISVYERVQATGQTKSYDATGVEVTDGSVKDDGYYKAGTPLNYERDGSTEIVTDHVTGLMWEDDVNVSVKASIKPDGTNYDMDAVCATRDTGAYNDWRAPTISELLTFADFGIVALYPKVAEQFPSWTISKSIYSGKTTYSWRISYASTFHVSAVYMSSTNYLRCVRGDAPDTTTNTLSRDNVTEIVSDIKTGLMWQDDANITNSGDMNWTAAIEQCETMELGGYDDWRLPNLRELFSITDLSNETIKTGFENVDTASLFWSSTSNVSDYTKTWFYSFIPTKTYDSTTYYANSYSKNKTDGAFKAMCVRTME